MAKTVRIPLPEAVPGHKGPITELVYRRPTFEEYLACGGEPYSIGQSEEGAIFTIEKPEVIRAYAETCLVKPESMDLVADVDFLVAREVRKTILGFFRGSDADSAPSGSSPTTSPSNSTSPSTPSDGSPSTN